MVKKSGLSKKPILMGNLVSTALSRSDSSALIRSRAIKKSWNGLENGADGSFANPPAMTCSILVYVNGSAQEEKRRCLMV